MARLVRGMRAIAVPALRASGPAAAAAARTRRAGWAWRARAARVVTALRCSPVFCVLDVSGGARVSGFTIRDGSVYTTGWQAASHPTGVAVANGMVSNCVIRANVGGTGAKIGNGGWVTHSRIVSNTTYTAVSIAGGAVLQDSVMAYHSKVVTVMGISGDGLVRRCRIHSNSANGYANIVSVGNTARLENSLIYANDAPGYTALAISGGVIDNCTVFGNSGTHASGGSGIARTGGAIRNTIIFGNTSSVGAANPDYRGAVESVYYSCSPDLTAGAHGNITDDPMLVDVEANDFRLLPGSPCRDAGTNLSAVIDDLVGTPRPQIGGTRGGLFHDMGAYEMDGTSGTFDIGFYGDVPLSGFAPLAVTFRANAVGSETNVTWYGWDFDNDGIYEETGAGLATVTHSFGAGLYSIALLASNSVGEAATSTNLHYVSVVGTDLYVATNGLHQFPFDTWPKAATNVHDAVDIAISGNTVHVGSGRFVTTNTLFISNFRLVGEFGPDQTDIALNSAAVPSLYPVVHVGEGGYVAGVTIRGGKTPGGWPGANIPTGLRVLGGLVNNCIVRDNSGGIGVQIENGTVTHSQIVSNSNYIVMSVGAGGILEESQVAHQNVSGPYDFTISSGGIVRRCQIHHNTVKPGWDSTAWNNISGAGSRLENSLVYANRSLLASHPAGLVVAGGDVLNCTIVANTNQVGSTVGAGIHQTGGAILNCIICGNMESTVGDYTTTGGTISHSLAPELTLGAPGSNRNDDPRFRNAAGGDYRLSLDSPCINAGTNQAWMWTATDLRGAKRISQSTVDMGAYETLPPASTLVILR